MYAFPFVCVPDQYHSGSSMELSLFIYSSAIQGPWTRNYDVTVQAHYYKAPNANHD